MAMIAIAGTVWSQSAAVERGDRNFKHFDFAMAADKYKTASDKAPNDIQIKEKLARSYEMMEDHVNAELIYGQLVKINTSAIIDRLYYGMELRANGKYDEAAKAFNSYDQAVIDDSRAKELSGNADKMKVLAIDNKIYQVNNLQDQNSPASEMGVAFFKDGILFSSNRGVDHSVIRTDMWTNRRFYDLYTSGRQGDKLSAPVKVKGTKLDRRFHEGPAVVSADGKELFFTRSNYKGLAARRSEDKTVKLKIMHADWNDTKSKWVNIKELSIDNDQYSVAHPALSKDGKRLYFISDMPGGLGETDLYVSYRDMSNTWGPAINLGPGVNTKGRELFPFIADDGTLYFSTDSRTGLGGLDIYSATFVNGMWGNVQNLGAPINTNSDDFGFIVQSNNVDGYFISNRPGGKGDDDIYKFKKIGVTLCGSVVDAISKAVLSGAIVKLSDANSVIATKAADDKGQFCFPVLPNIVYKLTAAQKDYEANSSSAPGTNGNQVVQIPLSKLGGIDLNTCVKQAGAGTLVGATVELTNKATGAQKTCTITADCKCKFDLEANSDYTLCAYKKSDNAKGSYDRPCIDITTKGKVAPASIYENLEMTYLEENMVIKIDNLYYDVNKWNIRPDAAVELDKLVSLMQSFPNMEIELSSHTDCRGSIKFNDDLSAKRAKSCVEYLVAHGIAANRMIAVGYGERKLVNNCACEGNVKSTCTDEQHQQNRRTEFKILKLK
jgi:outer membrane protein OmpA-like peptidoglycan-associated protein/tetratricopeptide (TPR) repeat protein